MLAYDVVFLALLMVSYSSILVLCLICLACLSSMLVIMDYKEIIIMDL